MSSSNDEESLPLWKNIIEKIKPFITREDIINMDLESFSALINRLFNIKKNRDLILIRMGLLHNIPDLNKEDLELGLKQLAVRLTSLYYRENLANNQEEAEKMVLKLIQQGFSSNVTISLNPEEEILKLREKLSMISKITLENAHEIRELLSKTKDDLMNIGVSGSVFYEIDKFIQMLKRKNETELPNKTEIIDASFEWQAKIQK
ncbi:MAG: hypothetical protein ACTSP3_01445 [Candidatus Heimdallarchaeaceae archaeon]